MGRGWAWDGRASGGPAPARRAHRALWLGEGDGARPRAPGDEGLEVREVSVPCPGRWTRLGASRALEEETCTP